MAKISSGWRGGGVEEWSAFTYSNDLCVQRAADTGTIAEHSAENSPWKRQMAVVNFQNRG